MSHYINTLWREMFWNTKAANKLLYFLVFVLFFILFHFPLFSTVDTVASAVQSTIDTTQKTAQSAIETGKSYAIGAKGINTT